MRNFIKAVLEKSKEIKYSKEQIFVQDCINRALSVWQSGWQRNQYNGGRLDKATRAEVRIFTYKFSYWQEKVSKYAYQTDLIAEINGILNREGITDWKASAAGDKIFVGSVACFYLSRATTPLTLGMSSLEEAAQIICQILCLKGFYPMDTLIYENSFSPENCILVWENSNPSGSDVYGLENLMTWGEMEHTIDTYIEPVLKEESKKEPSPLPLLPVPPHPIKETEELIKKILTIIGIIAIIYVLWKAGIIDMILKAIRSAIEKKTKPKES